MARSAALSKRDELIFPSKSLIGDRALGNTSTFGILVGNSSYILGLPKRILNAKIRKAAWSRCTNTTYLLNQTSKLAPSMEPVSGHDAARLRGSRSCLPRRGAGP